MTVDIYLWKHGIGQNLQHRGHSRSLQMHVLCPRMMFDLLLIFLELQL